MDTTKATTHIGLCAGYGGIELGLKRVIADMRTVALCEIEAFACANLVSKMEAGLMDPAPIWSDLKTFPWEEFRGKVDILTGGYPCQPFSAAGKRLGKDDPRHLWPYIADGIVQMRPRLCFFENVEGHITMGLASVISDLEEMGYEVSWGIFSAAEVGAPHHRRRVFILANSVIKRLERVLPNIAEERRQNEGGSITRCCSPCGAWKEVSFAADCDDDDSCFVCGDYYSECDCPGPTQDGIEYEHESERMLGRKILQWPACERAEQYQWEPPRILGSGLPLEHQVVRRNDGSANRMDHAELHVTFDNRTDELRLLGNGVVPATAEKAFRTLIKELQ